MVSTRQMASVRMIEAERYAPKLTKRDDKNVPKE